MNDHLRIHELFYTAYQSSRERHIYFLLAVAASAIALSVQQTRGQSLSGVDAMLGIAVVLWGASFFAGCYNRQWQHSYYIASQRLWKEMNKSAFDIIEHDSDPAERELSEQKGDALRAAIADRLRFWSHWQFWLLVEGAIFYLVWHVLGMVVRTWSAAPQLLTPS